jgi:glycerol-3-phosphate acyltransferase PlsY
MQHYYGFATAIILAYLIGSVSGAIILTKLFKLGDIRKVGSKNAGTTNMLRTHGKKAAVLTLIIDVLKGVLAVLIATILENRVSYFYVIPESFQGIYSYIAAVFVVLGHIFPVFFKFKGGKGVATSLGTILCLDWKIGLIVMVLAVLIMAVSKYVSLGSVIGAVLFSVLVGLDMVHTGFFKLPIMICAIVMSLMVILKHSSNIKRLINGTENKLNLSKK